MFYSERWSAAFHFISFCLVLVFAGRFSAFFIGVIGSSAIGPPSVVFFKNLTCALHSAFTLCVVSIALL